MSRRQEGGGTRTQLDREREGQVELTRGGSVLQSMLNRRRNTGAQPRGKDLDTFATGPLPDPDSKFGRPPGLHLPPQRSHHLTSVPGLLQQERGLAYHQLTQGTKPTPYASEKIVSRNYPLVVHFV